MAKKKKTELKEEHAVEEHKKEEQAVEEHKVEDVVQKKEPVKEELTREERMDIRKELAGKMSLPQRMSYYFQNRGEMKRQRKMQLRQQIEKSGLVLNSGAVSRMITIACVVLNIIITVYLFNVFYDSLRYSILFMVILLAIIWILIFSIVLFIMWLMFYGALDLAIFHRRQKLEEVLPDFLQLVSSNIRAGMTTDQALWYAVRPRFGVLAKEIEEVAKRTFAGEPLDDALQHFVRKYDSKTLERSINLLVEGMRAGGEVGELLNKIAGNIQETNIMKKEMAASVTTYIIFISFATIIAAPFLFGMAYQLIIVIQEVFSRVNITPGTNAGFPLTISKGVISTTDFKIFAVSSLLITSFFSSIIIAAIKKGDIKGGIKYIPMFMVSSLALFFIILKIFTYFVGGLF
jgi:flagellar protein FlaJ